MLKSEKLLSWCIRKASKHVCKIRKYCFLFPFISGKNVLIARPH